MSEDNLLRLEEVCTRLSIGIWTVRKLIKDGTIKAQKIGGQWRVFESEIDRIKSELAK